MAAATLSVGALLAILGAALEIPVSLRVDSHHGRELGGKFQGGRVIETSRITKVRSVSASLWIAPDDSIQHAGWDGVCYAPTDSTFIPAGKSVWEIGAQRAQIGTKAQDDYAKRTANPLGVTPSETCFIFFTPQRWPQKEVWAAERRVEGVWRDVRVIDGDTLVNWLELYPGVAEWLALRVRRRPEGLRNLGEAWSEWSLATTPSLSAELIIADRDDQAISVLRWLYDSESVLSVQAEAADEAIAFLHAAVGLLPLNNRIYWESRILAAQSDDVARQLIGLGPKLIVVLNGGDPGVAAALVNDGHHVYIAYGSDVGSPIIRLPRPWRHTIERELKTMGLSMLDARRFAGLCGRSLAVLRRILTASPASRPNWSRSAVSPSLGAAMMAGSWRQDHPADRKVLERLSGRAYHKLEADLAPLASSFDGPIRRSGPVLKLASLRDAWFLLGSHLTTHHLDMLEQCFLQVLGEPNPNFDADPDDRWKIDREPPRLASSELRHGLSETMIALGVFPEQASNVSDSATRSDRAVRALLSNADERVWWSLSDDFRNLAEAAPAAFLECVDDALDDPSPMASLFRSDDGFLHPSEYLSDLLWSLELLCWSPKHLGAGALLLARLADVDPGGKLGNRPHSSLTRIFLPWVPQTYATAEQRLLVLDTIIKRFDRIGWNLLLSLGPTNWGVSHPSAMPHWRDYSEHEPEPITRQGIAQAYAAIGRRLLAKAGQDATRWGALLELWANFDLEWRVTAGQHLAEAASHFPGSDRIAFRDRLRTLINKHGAFSDADWSMNAVSLAPLKVIFDSLEPTEVTAKHAWLFNRGNHHFRGGVAFEAAGAMLLAEQQSALKEIAAVTSVGDLIDYARTLELPDAVGLAFATSKLPDVRKDELLDRALEAEDQPIEYLAQRMIFALGQIRGVEWLWWRFDEAMQNKRPEREILPFALALPVGRATWDRIAAASPDLDRGYWRRLPNFFIPPEADFHIVVDKYLGVGRGRAALELIGGRPNVNVVSADILRLLRDPLTIKVDGPIDPNDGAMVPYYIGCAFKRLDEDASVSEDELVSLEWAYFNVLQHSDRPPRTLNKALSTNPRFFVVLLSAVFSSKDDVPPDDPAVLKQAGAIASQAFRVLEEWERVPGSDDNGAIDGVALEAWVKEARRLCAEAGRAEVGDSRIGRILSAVPRKAGESWPPEPVRDVIEVCRSRDLERGFQIGLHNRRGVTVRLPTDGGEQERELAAQYRADALACAFVWQRTQAMLERIAESYEHDATREDQGAERRDW
jgi:hypothetical protein